MILGLFVSFVVLGGGLVACGSGSGGGGTVSTGTTLGTYTAAVTGPAGNVTETGTVTINVQ